MAKIYDDVSDQLEALSKELRKLQRDLKKRKKKLGALLPGSVGGASIRGSKLMRAGMKALGTTKDALQSRPLAFMLGSLALGLAVSALLVSRRRS